VSERAPQVRILSAPLEGEVMVVCQCNDVSDKEILACVAEGITNYYEIQKITKCGRGCGSCMPKVLDVIYKEGAAKVANWV
jgi:NAD(P)H-nitrite reductase large subunit